MVILKNKVQLSLGENLKKLRIELGLRQHEIVGDEITRNLISMIENNKTPLYYRTAKLISNNINKISEERNMEVYISSDDIMNPERIEAKKQADRYIKELKDYIENKNYDLDGDYIKEIERFLKDWNIPEKKVIIYELLGDICYYNKDMQGEYMYLTRALENYFINPIRKDIYVVIIKLMANCIYTAKDNEAVRLCNLDIMKLDRLPKKHQATLVYNKALAYKKLKRYDKALESLSELKNYLGEENILELKESVILEGLIYKNIGKEDKAISKYKEYIELCEDNYQELGLAYSNIIDLFKDIGDKEKLLKNREKLISILPKIPRDDYRLLGIYYNLAGASVYLEEWEDAEEFYNQAFNQSIKDKEKVKRSKIVLSLLELYNKTGNKEKIFSEDSIIKQHLRGISPTDDMKIMLMFILLDIDDSTSGDIKELIKKFLE